MTKSIDTGLVSDWLASEGPKCASAADLFGGFCERLRRAGIPIDRSTIGAPLLRPIAQSSYVAWSAGGEAEQHWFIWSPEQYERLQASPIYNIYMSGEDVSVDLSDPDDRKRFPITEELWGEGFQDYHALCIQFADGTNKVFTAATRQDGGFSEQELSKLRALLPLLTIVYEGFIARNTAQTLMETYVGKRAGLRVLDGEIARGDGTNIDAVIWFSDMRNFTELSTKLNGADMLQKLNAYFQLITQSIEQHDGEILKFIGDAVLAIFPIEGDAKLAISNAENAALSALSDKNSNQLDFEFAVALHRGNIFYGNIGGGSRLDFTVIGPAVNTASRIEGLCASLDKELLVSSDVVSGSSRDWVSAGSHELKGISDPVEVFHQ